MNLERNLNFDMLRIVSALAVVAAHVTSKYVTDANLFGSNLWEFANIINNSSRFAVPMFFIISGFFLLNNNNDDYILFYKKKLQKVLVPFIFWSIFYIVYYLISIGDFNLHNIIKQLAAVMLGFPAYYHLWFFYHLIGLYFVTPLIFKLIEKLDKKDIVIIAIIFIFQSSIIDLYTKTFATTSNIEIPFSGYSFFYFLLGGLLRRFGFGWILKYKKLFFFFGFFSLLINIIGTRLLTNNTGKLNSLFMSEDIITILFYCITVFIIGTNLKLDILSKKVQRIFVKISGYTLGIYLIHPFVLDFFIENIHINAIGIFRVCIELVLTCSLTIFLTLIIKWIPIVNKIIP